MLKKKIIKQIDTLLSLRGYIIHKNHEETKKFLNRVLQQVEFDYRGERVSNKLESMFITIKSRVDNDKYIKDKLNSKTKIFLKIILHEYQELENIIKLDAEQGFLKNKM